jgi:hypothetical protein
MSVMHASMHMLSIFYFILHVHKHIFVLTCVFVYSIYNTHPTFFFFFSLEDYYVMLMKNAQKPGVATAAHHPAAPPAHPAVSQVKGSSLDSTLSNSLSFDSILSGTGSPGKLTYPFWWRAAGGIVQLLAGAPSCFLVCFIIIKLTLHCKPRARTM